MKSPRILLIGIDGVYNYGCEAIVRGTEEIIRKGYPAADIVYASRRPVDDQSRLKMSQVRIVKRKCLRRYSIKNIFHKLLYIIGIKWYQRVDSLRMLKDIDAVLSIGGDIYTLNSNGEYTTSLAKFGEASIKKDIQYVLWGASVGPFSANQKAEKTFRTHLKNVSLITARETATVKYLQKIGIFDNVIPCADPAYIVAPEIKADPIHKRDGLTIGINLSPLSVRYSKYSLEEAIYFQSRAIQRIVKAFDASIVLIPHVVCDFMERDDDLRYLRRLKQAITSEYQEAVTLLDNDIGFVGVKKELIKCDIVIAARMHCAINALAAHVPTILISYSRKAVGMCEYVYGHLDWVLSISDFCGQTGIATINQMLNAREEIRSFLSNRIPTVQRDAYHPISALRKLLVGKHS